MARIETIPWSYLAEDQQQDIEQSRADGMQSQGAMASQIFAYSSAAFQSMKQANRALFRKGVIEPRLQELIRLRSAMLNRCEPCAASRKETSVSEEDVVCMVDPSLAGLSARERLAVTFLERMAVDHESIDDAFIQKLHQTFSTAEIVELGWRCALAIGGHRFMHCLDMLGSAEPLIRFDPSEINKSTAPAPVADPA